MGSPDRAGAPLLARANGCRLLGDPLGAMIWP